MMRMILLTILALVLSGCAISTSQTHYIDATGHDCLKTLKRVAPLGIAVSENIECSETTRSVASEITSQKTQKKHWFFLWLF